MRKMKVLGKTAIILTPEEMLNEFGEKLDYVIDDDNKIVYIGQNLVDMETERSRGHLTLKDAVVDAYRIIRDVESGKSRYEALIDTIPRINAKK